jgi:hypothetical protein
MYTRYLVVTTPIALSLVVPLPELKGGLGILARGEPEVQAVQEARVEQSQVAELLMSTPQPKVFSTLENGIQPLMY